MSRPDRFARFAALGAVSDDLKRKSVLGALATGAGGALDSALRLASTMVLARLLVPEHFGLVAMVTAVTRVAERFSTLGLSTATVQTPEITHGQCSNLFWINAGAGSVFSLILASLSPMVAGFYGDARLGAITVALSLNFVGTGLTVQHEALLRRQMRLTHIAASRLTATIVSAGLAVALALGGVGYWALVWREIANAFLVAVGMWVLCGWVPGLPSRRVAMGRLLGFGRDMTVTQLFLAVSMQLDALLIGRFAGAAHLGFYRQAYNLMMMPIERLRGPIYGASQPGLSALQGEPGRYRRYYARIVFIVSLVTVPLGVFAAVYAREIVLLAFGEQWLGAVVFLRILGVVAAVQPAMGTTGTVMVTCGKTGRFLLLSLASTLVLALLMAVGIIWGAVGVAAARAATPVLFAPVSLHYSFKGTPVSARVFLGSIWRPGVAGAFMGAALLLLRYSANPENPLLSLTAGCVTGLFAYVSVLNILPGGSSQVRSLISELLGATRRRADRVESKTDATS